MLLLLLITHIADLRVLASRYSAYFRQIIRVNSGVYDV